MLGAGHYVSPVVHTGRWRSLSVGSFRRVQVSWPGLYLFPCAVCRCLIRGWGIVKCPLFQITSLLRALVISDLIVC